MALKAQVYSAVRVKDSKLERDGQVGVFLGPAVVNGKEVAGQSTVKFENSVPGGDQVLEIFKDTSLEPVL